MITCYIPFKMNRRHHNNRKIQFNDWHGMANDYTNRIIGQRIYQTNISAHDIVTMYLNGVHPYFAAVKAVVSSDEFRKGKIYESFVIPKKDATCLIRVIKNNM